MAECGNPEIHSENGGPFRYCACGWSEAPAKPITTDSLQDDARELIVDYFNERVEKTDGVSIGKGDTYVVWFVKTLQNWKALVSTTVPDGMYYELTFNGDKNETYIDAYKKFDNVTIRS